MIQGFYSLNFATICTNLAMFLKACTHVKTIFTSHLGGRVGTRSGNFVIILTYNYICCSGVGSKNILRWREQREQRKAPPPPQKKWLGSRENFQ